MGKRIELPPDYVVVSKLPEEQREPFLKWIQGRTIPVIETEPKDAICAYKSDYNYWLSFIYKK